MNLTAAIIAEQVSERFFERGRQYQRAGRVVESRTRAHDRGTVVTGRVRGSGDRVYDVRVETSDGDSETPEFDGECSCPVGYNCKHVVALLLEITASFNPHGTLAIPALGGQGQAPAMRAWLTRLAAARGGQARAAPSTERLLYLLDWPEQSTVSAFLPVRLVTCRILQTGSYGKPSPFKVHRAWQAQPARFLEADDIQALRLAGPAQHASAYDTLRLEGEFGARTLASMLETGRCHWRDPAGPLLAPGEPRPATLEWEVSESGTQTLVYRTDPPMSVAIPFSPPWYVNLARGRCGRLESGFEPRLASLLAAAPPVGPDQARALPAAFRALLKDLDLPRPETMTIREVKNAPVPCLRLFASDPGDDSADATVWWRATGGRPCRARLTFDYAGIEIGAREAAGESVLRRRDGKLHRVHRRQTREAQAVEALFERGLKPAPTGFWQSRASDERDDAALDLVMPLDEDESDLRAAWLSFMHESIPALRARGWRIEVAGDFDHRLLVPEDWTGALEEGDGGGWFNLALGVLVEGRVIPLLPILHDLFTGAQARSALQRLESLDAGDEMMVRHEGAWLCLPAARVRAIVDTIVELFNPSLDVAGGGVRLSAWRASEVDDIAHAAGDISWAGGGARRLAALAERVRGFTGIAPIAAPQGFGAQLRPYQEHGLGWLQYLREFGFSGILADDMGLGKTVQTLAHLLIEKQAGRLRHACLVVAPTSVIANWAFEARRFAPQLRVLTLHGAARHQRFEEIDAHDLVITTYALAHRDRERYAEHEYHVLILDEAQAVKNPRAKAGQALRALRANHRLCLTGTPLENHLGELWSLFDFLEPGLLGDQRQFGRLFRRPIEVDADKTRQTLLSRRITPFMLRRGKEEIRGELPDKVEIDQVVELHPQQRDLYESIRLAMHEKVQRALGENGFDRSRIVVLDALLKLRQVCCDPRLVKLDSARNLQRSAKLDTLTDILPEMIEEGRRILLFSQFTSMLKLIEERLLAAHVEFVKLTGRTRDRITPVARFQQGEVPVFLISLKAGGTGLNLTAADTVIHYDPWWNPAVEAQATDRAHRIGQDKHVFVYKLITAGTVEQRILNLQARKRRLADAVLDNAGAGHSGDLSAADLDLLLQPLD